MLNSSTAQRPRLSLQTQTTVIPRGRTSRSLANANPSSPTAFNTLSNVYVTAIERSTPVQPTPLTAINLGQTLKIQTNSEALKDQWRTQTPYTATYPDTPLSANTMSPMQMEMVFPSTMTATPPLSAGPIDYSAPKVFSFTPGDIAHQAIPVSPVQNRRKMPSASATGAKAPYTHPRSLHSILRNSPLPPSSAMTPISPRRQSLRLQEKAARRVGYESPLTQTITTEKYTKSHVDLLLEEVSPHPASPSVDDSDRVLDVTMAYTGNETRDGGQTPGPFEEMRRRMAGLGTETPISSPRPGGIRKRKKEKKRRWVWTIGKEGEDDENGAVVAVRAAAAEASTPRVSTWTHVKAATPEPLTAVKISIEPAEAETTTTMEMDVEMSDVSSVMSSSRATTPYSVDLELKTPTGARAASTIANRDRLESADLDNSETGTRKDTPIPPDLVAN